MDKVLIWGIGQFYDKYIARYVRQGVFNVIGFVTGIKTVCQMLDNKNIFDPDDIRDLEFDYIIIANQNHYREIIDRITSECKIPIEKCINGKVFKHPCFDWNRYKNVLESKPTIIAEACYGGYIYNQLGMKFYSPFVNTRIFERDYIRMLHRLKDYLQEDISLLQDIPDIENVGAEIGMKEISWGKMGYPIAGLADICLHAIHASNAEQYMNDWRRRAQRINWNNIWVMMIIENEEMLEAFDSIQENNKIGFYFKQTNCKGVVCLGDWGNFSSRLNFGHDFLSYVHHLFWDENVLRYIDIFKMFNGEKDFIRLL